jgi:hypothetical protein
MRAEFLKRDLQLRPPLRLALILIMNATPLAARGVHFEDISASDFGTPLSAAAPTSIDYLNAQLVAHGFAHGNGLNLTELRGKDQQVVLKCLANMLGQRLVRFIRLQPSSSPLDAFFS